MHRVVHRLVLSSLAVLAVPFAACALDAAPAPIAAPLSACNDVSNLNPRSALEYGCSALGHALTAARISFPVHLLSAGDADAMGVLSRNGVVLPVTPEAYAVVPEAGATWVIGSDGAGTVYGALDLVERLQLDGPAALHGAPTVHRPELAMRAANLFLVLPAPGEAWWFLDLDFWRQYLDLMAESRLNFLDIHGMYNADNTIFPNALLYFAHSPTFPAVGVSSNERDRNVRVLDAVVEMARVRGIEVGLMSYRSDTTATGDPVANPLSDDELRLYTREATEDLARRVPHIARLGFRIGESGHAAMWYADTFVAGVRAAGTGAKVYTRKWWTTKDDVTRLTAAAGGDLIVEGKFNGEQLGAPYFIAGGAFIEKDWLAYTYEDFLDPPVPYTFVFQLRAAGTHRMFRYGSLERTRRSIAAIAGSRFVHGFSLEAGHAFEPQHDFYHSAGDRFSAWTFRRDELMYFLYGRLGYEQSTPERVFRSRLAQRVGTDGLWEPMQAASEIVPWIQMGHTCGPDHRDYAPELELGGPVAYWADHSDAPPPPHSCETYSHGGPVYQGPFDTFALAAPIQAARDLVDGRATTRLSPVDIALTVLDASERARRASSVPLDVHNAEARDVQRELVALGDLGDHFAHKLRAATVLAVYAQTGRTDYLAAARRETSTSHDAWAQLVQHTAHIAPFVEHLRMAPLGLPTFHWRDELPRLVEDDASIDALEAYISTHRPAYRGVIEAPSVLLDSPRTDGPGLVKIDVTPHTAKARNWTVDLRFLHDVPPNTTVRVLWKPFRANVNWQSVEAAGIGTTWRAMIKSMGGGGLFAVEVQGEPGNGWRYPDVRKDTPYLILAPAPPSPATTAAER